MMKRISLAFGLLVALCSSSWAACAVTNLQVKDNAAVTAAVPYADDGSGASNCSPQIQIKQGGNVMAVTAGNAAKVDGSAVTQPVSAASLPLPTGAATSANQSTEISSLATIATNTGAATPAGTNIIGKVGVDQTTDGTTNGVRITSQYPSGAAAVQGSATGTTAATSTTLAATISVTNYVCSISIRANATAAATGNATLSDGTKTFNFTQWTAPNASGLGVVEEIFNPCYPASATNTAWTLTSAAPGTGGVVSVAIAGYQK